MGFWKGLSRLASGQPVFQPGDESGANSGEKPWQPQQNLADTGQDQTQQNHEEISSNRHYDSGGNKIIPEVRIGRCENHVSGDKFELWVVIENASSVDIEIDKVATFGATTQLHHHLRAGEEREFKVFSGPILKNGSYTKSSVYYKLVETGDYFQADYEVRYDYQSDGDYLIDEMRLIHPIRDI